MTDKRIFFGKWICAEEFNKINISGKPAPQNFHSVFKKVFTLKAVPKNAKIRITADDYYKLYINGKYVGEGPAPGYNFAYNYNEYDLSKLLRAGENIIKVKTYYQGLVNRVWCSGDGRQGMTADIYCNGELYFSTDSSWLYAVDLSYTDKRKTGYDTMFLEDRDLRKGLTPWKNCCETDHDYIFSPEPFPSIQVYPKEPVCSKTLENGTVFFDFKQEMAGCLKLHIYGKSGDKIIIRAGEELNADGSVRYDMRCNCLYEEYCILDDGLNIIEQFDYRAFRYAEIVPCNVQELNIEKFELMVRHFPFSDRSCVLETDDEILRSVFTLCKNTIHYGCQEVYVDCPTREKGQYIGDAAISGFSQFWLSGCDGRLLKKAIMNIAQSLTYDGEILAVTPCSLRQKIADYTLLFPLILFDYCRFTNDMDFLKEMLPVCEQINQYFSKFSRADGLLEHVCTQWNMVDWPENLRDNYDFKLTDPIGEGCHNVINAFYIGSIITTEKIKKSLDIAYTPISSPLIEAFHKCFYDKEKCLYTDSEVSAHSSLHANCIPVFFGFSPETGREKLAKFLLNKGFSCGVYMSYFYLKSLCILGKYSDVYDMIISREKHSWYNMLREGATTCFEAWGKEEKWNTSLFHPWACAPVRILIEDLLDMEGKMHRDTSVIRLPKKAGYFKLALNTPGHGTLYIEANKKS